MAKRRLVVGAFALALLLAGFPRGVPLRAAPAAGGGGPSVAIFRSMSGQVWACPETQPQNCRTPAYSNTEVFAGGEIQTGLPGQAVVETSAVVYTLRQQAKLRFLSSVDAFTRLGIDAGRIFLAHDPVDPSLRALEVRAGTTKIDAIDTRFSVEVTERGVFISLPKDGGSVTLTLDSGVTLPLASAQQILVPADAQTFPAVQALDSAEQARWDQVIGEWRLTPGIPPFALGQPATRYFGQTRHSLTNQFLAYWTAHGGLMQFGYPISDERIEPGMLDSAQFYDTQHFERAVFELHPENAGTPYEVELAQLGSAQYRARYGPGGAPDQRASTTNPRRFPATGKTIGDPFRAYWEAHDGLALLGYPISDEFVEADDAAPGKYYTVQYFERAKLEYHPENAGTPYAVLLSQLGTLRQEGKAAARPASRYFPQTGHAVAGKFYNYWTAHGGLAQFGYPISDEFAESSNQDPKAAPRLQYFERAILELHPENAGTPYEVEPAQLGSARYEARYGASGAPNQTASTINPRRFSETGKTIGGAFRAYWEAHGGLQVLGNPISDEFVEASDLLPGQSYTVQYFECAELEYHPENAGTPFEILPTPLGTLLQQGK